jgi:hypothetical protein
MKIRFLFFITFVFTLLTLPSLEAQSKKRLAVLPFSGGLGQDGETISILLSNQRTLLDAFTVQPRNSAIDKIMGEQQYQRTSGLINSDAISEIGKLNTADLVVSGHIASLGDTQLILISIIDVTEVQQVAGVYQTYRSIEEIRGLLPGLAQRLAETSRKNYNNLPGLAVPSFSVPANVNANDAMVLAQILATEIVNLGKYAVFPRNNSVDDVLKEHQFQRSGQTASAMNLGTTRNIEFILSSNVMSLGRTNLFGSQIINLERGDVIDGADREYQDIADGIGKNLMRDIAGELLRVNAGPANRTSSNTSTAAAPANTAQTNNTAAAGSVSVINKDMGWYANKDNRSSAQIEFNRESIDGRDRDVLTITINLANGDERWAGAGLENNNVSQIMKTKTGVRFKVLGDGKAWRFLVKTNEARSDGGYFGMQISTQRGKVVEVNVPFSRMSQPEWGRRVSFFKNSIFGIGLERYPYLGAGASTIKIFDFEIY